MTAIKIFSVKFNILLMKYDLLSSVISHRLHYNRINIFWLKVKEYVILVVGEGDEWEREEKSGR